MRTVIYVVLLFFLLSCSRPHSYYNDYSDIDLIYPKQTTTTNAQPIIITKRDKTFTLLPQAEYKVGAVILRKKRYRYDKLSSISPVDLALAWGSIAYPEYLKQFTVRQSKRRYRFFIKRNARLTTDWIYLNSSNNHIIPANDNLRRALNTIKRKDTVYIEGYLVHIWVLADGNSINIKTSLTREDKGDGACEIIYLTKLINNTRVYE